MWYKTKKGREIGTVACALAIMVNLLVAVYLFADYKSNILFFSNPGEASTTFMRNISILGLCLVGTALLLAYSNVRKSAEEVAERKAKNEKSAFEMLIMNTCNSLSTSVQASLSLYVREKTKSSFCDRWSILSYNQIDDAMHEVKWQLMRSRGQTAVSREIYEVKRISLVALRQISMVLESGPDSYLNLDKKKDQVSSLLKNSAEDAMSFKIFQALIKERDEIIAETERAKRFFGDIIMQANALGLNIYDPRSLPYPYSFYRKLRFRHRSFFELPADTATVKEFEEQLYL